MGAQYWTAGFLIFAIIAFIALCAAVAIAAKNSEQGLPFKIMCWLWCAVALLCNWGAVILAFGSLFGIMANPLYPSYRGLAVMFVTLTQLSFVIVSAMFFVLFYKRRPILCYIPLAVAMFAVGTAIDALMPAWQ